MYFRQGKVPLQGTSKTPNTSVRPSADVRHMHCCRDTHPAQLENSSSSAAIRAMQAKEYTQLHHCRASPMQAVADAHACPGLLDPLFMDYGNHTGALTLSAAQELQKSVDGVHSYKLDTNDFVAASKYRVESAKIDCEHRNASVGQEVHPIPSKLQVRMCV